MIHLENKIKELATVYFNEVVALRRHFHQNPELSFMEFETSAFICDKLEEYGIRYQKGIAQTGILARIEGTKPGKVIALRADMDALPIVEKNELSYCSINKGVMHACGHDVHVASLLGTAIILKTLEQEIEGTVLFIFQPGEEKYPGGARLMLEDGLFKDLKPDLILAQHVFPELETGKVGFKPGIYMASADEIFFTVKGQGGHGALPHKLTDTVLIMAHIITALQQITSRNAPADIPTVLSFGKVEAYGANNIIPDEVNVAGTLRTMNETWRKEAKKRMQKMACSIAEGMGGTCEFKINHGYPALVNDDKTTFAARSFACDFLGKENIAELNIRMTSEDFAYFSQDYPVAYYRLGIKTPGADTVPSLHTSSFNIDENALITGMGTMAYLALRFLKE